MYINNLSIKNLGLSVTCVIRRWKIYTFTKEMSTSCTLGNIYAASVISLQQRDILLHDTWNWSMRKWNINVKRAVTRQIWSLTLKCTQADNTVSLACSIVNSATTLQGKRSTLTFTKNQNMKVKFCCVICAVTKPLNCQIWKDTKIQSTVKCDLVKC